MSNRYVSPLGYILLGPDRELAWDVDIFTPQVPEEIVATIRGSLPKVQLQKRFAEPFLQAIRPAILEFDLPKYEIKIYAEESDSGFDVELYIGDFNFATFFFL